MDEKMLYTLADVAAALSVSRSKVYELVRSGALPSVRIGGSRRVRERTSRAMSTPLSACPPPHRRVPDEQGTSGECGAETA